MWCIVDASVPNSLSLYTSSGASWQLHTFSIQSVLEILPTLQNFLSDQGLGIGELKGLGIVQGKGTFTSTRMTATIANTLHFALALSVVAVREIPSSPPTEVFSGAAAHYVLPTYSAPPSIGKKN